MTGPVSYYMQWILSQILLIMHGLPVDVIYLERLSILYLNIDYLRLRVVPPCSSYIASYSWEILKLDQLIKGFLSDIENNVLSEIAVYI